MAESADCNGQLCVLWLVGLAFSVLDRIHVAVQFLQWCADRAV